MTDEPLFELRNASKTYGATRALREAGLTVYPGEVHGLLGTNGSGKSTMLKMLSGVAAADPGAELAVRSARVALPGPDGSYRKFGWGFVHQDLGLYTSLRVTDNFHLVGPTASPGVALSWRREHRRVGEALRLLELDIDPRAIVGDLAQPQRALVAIARAIYEAQLHNEASDGREVLFLDEPTTSLEDHDRQRLTEVIKSMTDRGSAVVIVSHDLAEVRRLTHRVTVLRDGQVVGAGPTSELSESELLTLVAGSVPEHQAGRAADPLVSREAEYSVTDLAGGSVSSVSFSCRPGEILGLTGLAGSGFDQVPYLMFGVSRADRGTIRLLADQIEARSMRPDRAIDLGICLVPGSRRDQGVVADVSVRSNITLPSLHRYTSPARWISRSAEQRDARVLAERVGLVPPDVGLSVAAFSGGNQQKALLAKWFNAEPRLLLLHEPTVGIDVRARAQVHQLLRQAAGESRAIVCVSGDFEQLEQLCDRVLVMRRGRICAELTGPRLTKTVMARESVNVSDD